MTTRTIKAILADIAALAKELNDAVNAPTGNIDLALIDRLAPALQQGGPLNKQDCDSNSLRSFSRAWRAIVRDLRKHPTTVEHQTACAYLKALGVDFRDGENNSRTFFVTY